jgi:hypothetical protein
MVSKSVWAEFFGSLRYRIILSANEDILTVSLPICIPFISSSCLIAQVRNSSTMLSSSGDSGHPYLIPDLAVGLSCIAFTMMRYIPSIPGFLMLLS